MCAGYVVCNHGTRLNCDFKISVHPLDKKTGTKSLEKHAQSHIKEDSVNMRMGQIEDGFKCKVNAAAEKAYVFVTLPLRFA